MPPKSKEYKQAQEIEEQVRLDREKETKAFALIVEGFEMLPHGRAAGVLAYVNERFGEEKKKDRY